MVKSFNIPLNQPFREVPGPRGWRSRNEPNELRKNRSAQVETQHGSAILAADAAPTEGSKKIDTSVVLVILTR